MEVCHLSLSTISSVRGVLQDSFNSLAATMARRALDILCHFNERQSQS